MRNLLKEKTLARAIVPLTVLLGLCCLLLSGCRSLCPKGEAFHPEGELLAYVKIKWAAFNEMPKGDCGTFFYIERDNFGSRFVSYEVWDGRVQFMSSSRNLEILRDLEAIGFEPFDYEAEVASLSEEKLQESLPLDRKNDLPVLPDGVVQEIFIHTDKGDFLCTLPNAGNSIDYYAYASGKIARLKAYLDSLALVFGRARMVIDM